MQRPAGTESVVTFNATTPRRRQKGRRLQNRNGAETTSCGATTPRQHQEGHHLGIATVRKLLVLAPRHPANTARVVTYES